MCCVFAFLPPMQPAFSLRRCSARISANEYNLRHLDSRSHVLLRRVTRVHSDVLTSLIRYKMLSAARDTVSFRRCIDMDGERKSRRTKT